MSRDSAHVARRGIVHDAAPRLAGGGVHFGGRDARAQRSGRKKHRVAHAERLVDLLANELVQGLAADPANDFAQKLEIDIAIDEAFAGRIGGLVD